MGDREPVREVTPRAAMVPCVGLRFVKFREVRDWSGGPRVF